MTKVSRMTVFFGGEDEERESRATMSCQVLCCRSRGHGAGPMAAVETTGPHFQDRIKVNSMPRCSKHVQLNTLQSNLLGTFCFLPVIRCLACLSTTHQPNLAENTSTRSIVCLFVFVQLCIGNWQLLTVMITVFFFFSTLIRDAFIGDDRL